MFQPTDKARPTSSETIKMTGYTTINNENGACGRCYAGVRRALNLIVCNMKWFCLSPNALCHLSNDGAVSPFGDIVDQDVA